MTQQGLLAQLQDAKFALKRPDVKCAVKRFYETLSKTEVAKYEQVIDDKDIVATKLAEVFKANKIDIPVSSIRYHRKRMFGTGCACPLEYK